MKKFFKAMCIALLCVCATVGISACGGGESSGGQSSGSEEVKNPPVISNKPTDATLTFTTKANTYQFETAAYDGTITWISTVESVATISQDGLLTMLGAGNTEVIAKDEATGLKDSVVLTIVDGRVAETLTVTGLPQTLRVGDAAVQLSVTSSEDGAVDASYVSSNPGVATVSETGLLVPVGKGVTEITVTKAGSELATTIRVEVLGAAVASVQLCNMPKYGMLVGQSYPLSVVCQPADCEEYEIEWSVDNTDVVVLVGAGQMMAIAAGQATVTATVKGTQISASQTLTVSELSATSEDFRFATAGTANVMNVGPTIAFSNVDGEIVEYGNDQALQISTRGNNAYNYVMVEFDNLDAGNYKVSMLFKVIDGRHSGAIVLGGETKEMGYVMAGTALGDDHYAFYFTQNEAGSKKIAISAQQWKMEGTIIIDDILIEKVDEIPTTVAAGVVDDSSFDSVTMVNGQSCDINGVYVSPRKFATELVDDANGGKALKVTRLEGEYAYIAISLGNIKAGNYTLTMDIENSDYQAIVQVLQMNTVNGIWKAKTLQDIKYGELDTIFEHAEQNGNTYTLSFSVANDVDNFAIGLSTNLEASTGESIIIDNIVLSEAPVAQTIDFDKQNITVLGKLQAAGNVDLAKSMLITSEEINDKGYETEGDNTYYKATFVGWNTYSLFNLGTLPAGEYVIALEARLLSGQMSGRFVTMKKDNQQADVKFVQHDLVENVDYIKSGDQYIFLISLENTTSEFCIGYRSAADAAANFTLAYESLSIAQKVDAENVAITAQPQGTVMKGSTFNFAASVTPTAGVWYVLEWSVDDESIATIDANGKLTALKAGECTVTVTIAGTDIKASVIVTVEQSTLPPDVAGGEPEGTAPDGYGDWILQ